MLATASVVVLRTVLGDLLGPSSPTMLFILAVTAAAWIGGFVCGLFTIVLSAAAGLYFFVDHTGLDFLQTTDPSRTIRFAVICLFLCWVIESMHVAAPPPRRTAAATRI